MKNGIERTYYKNGKIEKESYYLNGNEVTNILQLMVIQGLEMENNTWNREI